MATIIISVVFCLSLFFSSVPAYSAVFNISSGDVAGLIAAINAANASGEENTINLAPGTYTLTSIDNGQQFGDSNGLPVITGTVTLNGESAETTIIERSPAAPRFRIFHFSGKITLNRVTIRGGWADSGGGILSGGTLTITDCTIERNVGAFEAGGIFNRGTLSIFRSIIRKNIATFDGGGIFNASGTATIMSSTIAHNFSENAGGIQNGGGMIFPPPFPGGTVTVHNSTISNNNGDGAGGIRNLGVGVMTVTNSTIANNSTLLTFGGTGGISNSGVLHISNSTVADNRAVRDYGFPPGVVPSVLSGIENRSGTLDLQNTIVDRCSGPITSLGNNIIADLTDCGISLLSNDLTGDPDLSAFIDDGAPGHGRFPLLTGSPAIDAGNDAACPSTDQLVTPRRGACDIGAIEFYPVVNDLVAVGNVSTDFDATPVPGGPAGVFRVTTDFTNRSNQGIVNLFVEVLELTGGNLLLNADGGAGGVGARLTLPDSTTTPFQPGATNTFEFLIGLQQRESFTFFVNMLGEPGTSSPYVNKRLD